MRIRNNICIEKRIFLVAKSKTEECRKYGKRWDINRRQNGTRKRLQLEERRKKKNKTRKKIYLK